MKCGLSSGPWAIGKGILSFFNLHTYPTGPTYVYTSDCDHIKARVLTRSIGRGLRSLGEVISNHTSLPIAWHHFLPSI